MLRFFVEVISQFNQQQCLIYASALTVTTLLALVPMLVTSLYILAMFPVYDTVGAQIQTFILNNFVPTSSETISVYLSQFVNTARQLPHLGLAWLVVMVFLFIRTIDHVFNTIWQIDIRPHHVWTWLGYWLVLAFIPIILGTSILISTYLQSLHLFANHWPHVETRLLWIRYLPIIMAWLGFALLYHVTPNTHVPWRYALLSGLVAAILLAMAKHFFTWSLLQFPAYQLIYGALSVIPLFLLWIQLSWMIILLGAVICRTFWVWDKQANEKVDLLC